MSRRMDISSLLCQADPPSTNNQHTPHLSRPRPPSPVNNPVILAPHLRGRHTLQHPTTTMTTTDDHRHQLAVPHSEHNMYPDDTRQPSSPVSHGYSERPRTIDALLHHPPAHARPQTEHHSRSPTSVASLLNHPLQHHSPDSQSPASSAPSYSPSMARDHRQLENNTHASKASPTLSLRRPSDAHQSARASHSPLVTNPYPYSHPHLRSSPEILAQSQHRALSSVSHPYSPPAIAPRIHTSHQATEHTPGNGTQPMPPLTTLTTPCVMASASEPAFLQKQRSPFSGFEALVHAASEERRRISGAPGSAFGMGSGSAVAAERERESWRDLERQQQFTREEERKHTIADQSPTTFTTALHDRPSTGTLRRDSHPFTHAHAANPYPQPPLYSSPPQQIYPMQINTHHLPSTSFEHESRPPKRRRAVYSPPQSRSPSRSPSSSSPLTTSLAGDPNQSRTPNSSHGTSRRHVELSPSLSPSSMRSTRMALVADDRSDDRVGVGMPFSLAPLCVPARIPTAPSETLTSKPQLYPHTSAYVRNQPHHFSQTTTSGRRSPQQHSPRHSPQQSNLQYSLHPHPSPQHLHQSHVVHPVIHAPAPLHLMSTTDRDERQAAGSTNSLGLELPSGKLVTREKSTLESKQESRQEEGDGGLKQALFRQETRYDPVQVQVPLPRLATAEREDEGDGLSTRYTGMQPENERNSTVPFELQAHQLSSPLTEFSRKRKTRDLEVRPLLDNQTSMQPLHDYEEPLQAATPPRHRSSTPSESGPVGRDETPEATKWSTQEEDRDEEAREVTVEGGLVPPLPPARSPARCPSPSVLTAARSVTSGAQSASVEPSLPVTRAQVTLAPPVFEDEPTDLPLQSHLPSRSPRVESRSSPSTPVQLEPTVKIEQELPTAQLYPPKPPNPPRSPEREALPPSPGAEQVVIPTYKSGSRPGTPKFPPTQHASDTIPSKLEEESSFVPQDISPDGPPNGELDAPSDLREVASEVRPKLEPIRSSPEIRSRSPSNLSLPTPTKEEVKFTFNEPQIPDLPSSRSSPQPEPAIDLTQRQLSIMDVDEELLSLVEDRPSRHRSSLTPVLPHKAPAKSVYPPAPQAPSRSPAIVVDEEKDRASMPPPAVRTKKGERADKAAAGSTKKKEGVSKPPTKHKPPAKPRTKPPLKTKAKSNDVPAQKDATPKGGFPVRSGVNTNARSRSTSVIPVGEEAAEVEVEADDSEKEDDKLYCVCKTRYDEDKMMIACDRCDEWYHTQCVSMPDLELELVDQFICPPCVQKLPHLRTTWKRRCLLGLKHDDPSSPGACHKPARGAFSKYCSDECGIKYMQSRIAQWEKSGGNRDVLWENVKTAEKRQGVVIRADGKRTNEHNAPDRGDTHRLGPDPVDAAAKRRTEREVARLNARLAQVVKEREMTKREMDVVLWREKVVELASERAERVEECGWDQRLCFGEEEWADFGVEVIESYDEDKARAESGDEVMQADSLAVGHGEWWCTGKKRCDRHAGWQKLRSAEVSFEKELKEGLLLKLTTREREIRKGIEDILYPQSTSTSQAPRIAPARLHAQLNGSNPSQVNGDIAERVKKRKS